MARTPCVAAVDHVYVVDGGLPGRGSDAGEVQDVGGVVEDTAGGGVVGEAVGVGGADRVVLRAQDVAHHHRAQPQRRRDVQHHGQVVAGVAEGSLGAAG